MSHKVTKKEIEHVTVASLTPYARNSRTHSPQQVKQIAASIREFGFTNPILIDDKGTIIAGHGRVLAAEHLQMKEVPAIRLSHLTAAQQKAYVIADNKIALNAGWDDEMLKIELNDLHSEGFDLGIIGFEPEELLDILELDTDYDGVAGEAERSDGSLLAAASVTIDDPKTKVESGQVWRLGVHRLVVSPVAREWPAWIQYLTDGTILCPYGTPFVLLGELAAKSPILVIQPDTYIAGHLIDKWIEINGSDSVVMEAGE